MNSQQKLDDYQLCIRALSDRIVEAQTPIRVLDAVKWDDGVRQGFLEGKGKRLPAVDRAFYEGRPLGDRSSLQNEGSLEAIEQIFSARG